MKKHQWMLVTVMSVCLVGPAIVRADTGTQNQGNFGDIISKDTQPSVGTTRGDTVDDTGRFLSHDVVAERGGVGNYLSPSEAKRYDERVAREQNLSKQQAGIKAEEKANPDEGVVYFDTGSADLSNDDRQQVASMANELKKDPNLIIEVNGYTDNTGNDQANQKLSQARAESVKNELASNGVNDQQITTYAYGKDEPLASNDTSAGRSVNRRAELYIESNTG